VGTGIADNDSQEKIIIERYLATTGPDVGYGKKQERHEEKSPFVESN
jgi:hypothetical protein